MYAVFCQIFLSTVHDFVEIEDEDIYIIFFLFMKVVKLKGLSKFREGINLTRKFVRVYIYIY